MTLLAELFPFALHHVWQAGLVALALAAGYGALRGQPGARAAAGLGAFALAALIPLAAFLPELSFGGGNTGTALLADSGEAALAGDVADESAWTGAEAGFAWDRLLARIAVAVMILGSAVLVLRTLYALIAAERLRAESHPIPLPAALDGRFAGAEVRSHERVMSPMVVGTFAPAILLPEDYVQTRSTEALAAILEHERAHVTRRDPAVALVQRLVLALFWWNPAMHWISARIDRDREMACDSEAVRRCGSARTVAITLADEAEARLTGRIPALAVGAMEKPSELRRRIDALLSPSRGTARAAVAAPLLLAAAAGLAAWATPKVSLAETPTAPMVEFTGFSASQAALGLALVEAAMRHDMTSVRALVEAGAPVDYAQPGDGTALIEAARTGDTAMARYLLAQGADVDLAVPGDGNPLIVAAANRKFDMVRLLVEAGADVNAYVPGDETPLIAAARAGKIEAVRYLVEQGADVNLAMWTHLEWRPEFRSPLWAARQSGKAEIVSYLESRGAVHEPSARP